METNVTIIIPHYCIPDLLCRCLRSIPRRDDVEVLVVDDGTPGFDALIPSLQDQFGFLNVSFLSTGQHANAGKARNVGLERATGKWLFFADADDFFTDDFSSALDRYMDSTADIIYFRARSVMSDDITIPANRDLSNNYKMDTYLRSGNENVLRFYHGPSWPLLIRRQLCVDHDIRFHEVEYSNDGFFVTCCGYYAKTIAVDNAVIYTVTLRHNSLSCKSRKDLSAYESRIRAIEAIEIAKFIYIHTGKMYDELFATVIWALLYHPVVAWEVVQMIHKEFNLSVFGVIVHAFCSTARKATASRIYRLGLKLKSWNRHL